MRILLCALLFILGIRKFPLSSSTMSGEVLDQLKDVEIDPSGRFKYILIEVEDEKGNKKFIVRGTARCNYHVEIYNEFLNSTSNFRDRSSVPGGGRIFHSPEKKTIHIYSESQQFGKANHKVTKNLLQKHYSDYNIAITREEDEPFA
ncbi:sex-regulated protein janus-A-like isoform X2 [Planococcus citri]|uniref:sex-regulated protein janus-A-like isoform X2 n=1 Tax=Planococcus citri TaxID=170843 RepID=UPI0031F9E21E